MKRAWRRGAALLLLTAAASTARAHHSLTYYDRSKEITVTGAVVEFQFIQPHPFLLVEVQTAAGGKQVWRVEMDDLDELRDARVSKDTFKRGDRVTVVGAPNRNGTPAMYLERVDRPADRFRLEQVGSSPVAGIRPKT